MSSMENETRQLPELGTPVAALRSVVNLISRAVGQPEEILAYWLDLYYQVRQILEMENAASWTPPAEKPAEFTPPEPSGITEQFKPFEPSKPEKATGAAAAAKFKRETLQRLQAARKDGLSTPQIVKLAENNITEDQVREILDAKPVPVAVYRILAAALDRRELNE